MRWPWRSQQSKDRLVLAWSAQSLAYLQARAGADGKFEISQMGVEHQGTDDRDAFAERLRALGLQGGAAWVMLRTDQYQMLQIDAPNVPAEELRQAARYQIREMVDTHLDDLTIDVLKVGDGQQKSNLLFVVVTNNSVVREATELCQSADWPLSVIDIHEIAQRNLQTALATRNNLTNRATALLLVTGPRQAVLTISANEELFFSRRLDLPDGFLEMDWNADANAPAAPVDAYTPVTEYVPDYASGASYDYSSSGAGASAETERAQRLVVEMQRSLDLWDRTWSALPLAGVWVHAGGKTQALAEWLSRELGQNVQAAEFASLFASVPEISAPDLMACTPLMGALLRTEAEG